MTANLRAAAVALLIAILGGGTAFAQKRGGILKMYSLDSPASMSIHEEITIYAEGPTMGVFNNLVMFDQRVKQNSLSSVVPDLATGWSWNEDGTELSLPLRQGVKWHDGEPFTARDVRCTWDLLTGQSSDKLRVNPRKSWYANLDRVTTNGDYEVSFHLKRPQPAFLTFLASGYSPVYTLSRAGARDAQSLDWHRPVQIRGIQAERVDQGDAKPGLLEKGSTVSRRYRIYDHPQPLDGRIGIRLREV
jgi:ABC-type transport system substrate-binding protein